MVITPHESNTRYVRDYCTVEEGKYLVSNQGDDSSTLRGYCSCGEDLPL
jgi:hypothetical protein